MILLYPVALKYMYIYIYIYYSQKQLSLFKKVYLKFVFRNIFRNLCPSQIFSKSYVLLRNRQTFGKPLCLNSLCRIWSYATYICSIDAWRPSTKVDLHNLLTLKLTFNCLASKIAILRLITNHHILPKLKSSMKISNKAWRCLNWDNIPSRSDS